MSATPDTSTSSNSTAACQKKRKSDLLAGGPSHVSKEAKKPKTGIRRKAGRLAGLLSIPLDVLMEIFGHLNPYDLLKLSRMNKEFRSVLMSRNSSYVWRASLSNVPGLPECPPNWSEPRWANLAFSPHCHICLAPNIRNVEWRFRIRLCPRCSKQELRISPDYYSLEVDYGGVPIFTNLIPKRRGKRYMETYLIRDFTFVREKYNSLEDDDAKKAFVEERKEAVAEITKHALLCEAWAKEQLRDRGEELQRAKDDRKAAIIEKLQEAGWGDELAKMQHDILTKFEEHKLVKQPQRLTDRIWSNINAPMIEFMEYIRQIRLTREREALIVRRKESAINILRRCKNAQLPYLEILPEGPDFCDLPVIKEILEHPSEVDVNEASFIGAVPLLPSLFKKWRDGICSQLAKLIQIPRFRLPKFYGLVDHDSDEDNEGELPAEEAIATMKLASTVFTCAVCITAMQSGFQFTNYLLVINRQHCRPLFYPDVLGHECMTRELSMSDDDFFLTQEIDYSTTLEMDEQHLQLQRKKWDRSSLTFNRSLSEIASQVVEAAGLDPTTATAADMDQLLPQPIFACLRCSRVSDWDSDDEDEWFGTGTQGVYIFDWRQMVSHYGEKHHPESTFDSVVLIQRMTPTDLGEIFEQVEVLRDKVLEAKPIWCCVRCRDLPSEKDAMNLEQVKAHLLDCHTISDPQLNEDYFKHFAYKCNHSMTSDNILVRPPPDSDSE